MSNDDFKRRLFEQFALVGKAISNAGRLELIEFLAQGERSVDALAKSAKMSKANASQHLHQLKTSGLVTARKEGQHVFYSLVGEEVVELLGLVRKVAEKNLAEVDKIVDTFLKVKDDLEAIAAEELWNRAKEGVITVIDVRPKEEYLSGHIPGSVNIPIKELKQKLKDIPKGREVVAYCRGPYCIMSFEAVELLRKAGFKARRFQDGLPEWRNINFPVEK